MSGQQPSQYYRPYDSADESGADSDVESTDSWYSSSTSDQSQAPSTGSDGVPNFRAFASQMQLRDAAGPQFSTMTEQLKYGSDRIGRNTVYSGVNQTQDAPDPNSLARYGKTEFATSDSTESSIIMIDSRFRDRQAYPQPTLCTLRLPRPYKNITNIAMAEMKLLTSFYFFRASKRNIDITIYEKDRFIYDQNNQLAGSTIVSTFITEGTYNINQLQTELQIKLNYTPLFYDFIGGFNQFYASFRASGDLGLNFNEPGDYFYNNTTNTYTANPTKDTIILHFWRQRNFGLQSYSIQQTTVAYYYPVLNEAIQDENFPTDYINLSYGLGIDPTITTPAEVRERILLTFQGLDDPVIFALIQGNLANLDAYRIRHTFRYALINKYVISREQQSQKVYITSPSLNTSLVNLLNIQRTKYTTRALQLYNITARQYLTLQSNADYSRAIIQGMLDFTQSNYLTYFAVPWDQYSAAYYAGLNNVLYLQNAEGVTGLPSNSFEALTAGIQTISTSVLASQTINPVYYWPNLKNMPTGRNYYLFNLSSATSSFNKTYDMTRQIFSPTNTIVEAPKDYIYNDYLTASANVVCPIQSGKYTIFKFHSPVRQTLQVETLQRPLQYRLPKYNQSNYDSTINHYFDFSYEFNFTSNIPYAPSQPSKYSIAFDNLPTSNLTHVIGWNSNTSLQTSPQYSWARSFSTSIASVSTIDLTIATPYRSLFYTFVTPTVKDASPNSNYTYSLNLTTVSLTSNKSETAIHPPQDVRVFIYHDRGAFQADVLSNRNENPLFYKFSTLLTTSAPSTTITFTTYPQQQYYVSVRPDATNYGTMFLKTFPWFSPTIISTAQTLSVNGINPATDPFTSNFNSTVQTNFNYAQVYDSNWIRLPIQSTLWVPDPSAATSTLGLGLTPIGYDSNGVSTDYTDYIPFSPFDSNFSFNPTISVGIDPINTYQFQSNSAYDSSITNSWLYPNSLNSVFLPALEDVYEPGTVAIRQEKIAHYYSLNYIPEPELNFPLPSNIIASNDQNQKPYSLDTTQGEPIPGYSYSSNEVSTIQLGRGVLGFSFIPQEGIWDIQKALFRTAISDYDTDPNQTIKYLGVYNLGDILYKTTANIRISSAILLLSSISRITYSNSTDPVQAGFDVKGGTYYEFGKDLNFKPSGISTIIGYSQTPKTMSDQPESMYTFIAFSEFGFPTTIKALSGSAIPFPLYNSVFVSSTYVDGSSPYDKNYSIVFPSSITQSNWPFAGGEEYGPSSYGDITQSAFQLSLPIGTSVLPFKQPFTINNDSNFLQPWQTTMTPSRVIGTLPDYVFFQDTNFTIYKYNPLQANRTFTTPVANLTGDTIFPNYENTALVGVAGNTANYYFLGFSNLGQTSNRLRLKKFSPKTGEVNEIPLDTSYVIPWHTTVKTFTVNNYEQLVLTAKFNDSNTTTIYYSLEPSTNMTSYTLPGNSNGIHAMDPITSTLYYMPLNSSNVGTTVFRTTLESPFETGQPWLLLTESGLSNWTQFAVNDQLSLPAPQDRIFAVSASNQYQSNAFFSASWDSNTYTIQMDLVSTPITQTNGQGAKIGSIDAGFGGSLWITSAGQPIVWVNRNTEPDQDGILDAAWQIFYPFQKIVLVKLANSYNPITDLTNIDYPEYPHTMMFYYRNGLAFSNDTFRKWGLESNTNFNVANTTFSGYYFNSYITNVPLIPSSNGDYQYITVRGFSPTETSETLMRFSLTNQYNFGYITEQNLIDEISIYTSSPQLFNTTYANTLEKFNVAFAQSNSFFGQGLVPDFDGSNVNSSNFSQFITQYSTIYANYNSISLILSNITSYINSNVNLYISTNLQYIFPTNFQQRQIYSDPVSFSILWLSSLLPNYRVLLEDWGMGYNLGFAKVDTPFSTYHRAESFYKILEDYIYLRLNPEYPMNRLDSTAKEDFKITRESTGQIQFYFGKLLLNDFNSYSRSFVNNQLIFNPPIPKLENMYFEWVDVAGNQIDNNDCEWACSITITESKVRATATSGQPKLPPPEKK